MGKKRGILGLNVAAIMVLAVALVASPFAAQNAQAAIVPWGPIKDIQTGGSASCVLTESKKVYCWSVAPTIIASSSVPVQMNFDGKDVEQVSVNSIQACVVTSDGQGYCWGDYTKYTEENGIVDYISSSEPVNVNELGGLQGKIVKQISIGVQVACALTNDQEVYCWGSNHEGYLGLGENAPSANVLPTRIDTTGALNGLGIVQISSDFHNTCAIATDYKAYCWGENSIGLVGNGTVVSSPSPSAVDTSGVLAGKQLQQIKLRSQVACALDTAGKAYCWGDNYAGQIGDASQVPNASSPVAVATDGVLQGKVIKAVSPGHAPCVLATDDTLSCWGFNQFYGMVGDGTMIDRLTPVASDLSTIDGPKDIKLIDVGSLRSCLVTVSNKVYCWGSLTPNKTQVFAPGTTATLLSAERRNDEGRDILRVSGVQLGTLGEALANPNIISLNGQTVPACTLGTGFTTEVFESSGIVASDTPLCYWLAPYSAAGYSFSGPELYMWLSEGFDEESILSANGSESVAISTLLNGGESTDPTDPVDPSEPIVPTAGIGESMGTILNASLASSQPTFTGYAEPGAVVTVTIRSDPITCTTTADISGRWRCTFTETLPVGLHTVSIQVVNPDESIVELGPYPVTVAGQTGSAVQQPPTVPANTQLIGSVRDVVRLAQNSQVVEEMVDEVPVTQANETDSAADRVVDTPSLDDESEVATQDPDYTWVWWGVIGMVLIGIVAVSIIGARKKSA
jgi:alpha-tubulin suppressor-like RCC1 family protein